MRVEISANPQWLAGSKLYLSSRGVSRAGSNFCASAPACRHARPLRSPVRELSVCSNALLRSDHVFDQLDSGVRCGHAANLALQPVGIGPVCMFVQQCDNTGTNRG